MSGKGAKGLIMGKTPAANKDKDKDKGKKKPVSRSSRAGLQFRWDVYTGDGQWTSKCNCCSIFCGYHGESNCRGFGVGRQCK